jgi:short-subunit dehydrogenase
MLSIFLQGLRNRLHPAGVHVLTVKPGFVDSPMTSAYSKGLLWASPDRVAQDIEQAIIRRSDQRYAPRFWRWIMLIIKIIPERYFKRLRL